MRHSDWYFRGYERVEQPKSGGKKTAVRMVYFGDWYGFPGGKRQGRAVKLACALLSILVAAAFFYAQLNPSLGGRVGWLGGTSLLALVPLMFEAAAFFSFLPAGEKWEYRVYHAGYRKLFRSGCVLEGIVLVWLLMELWFVLRFPELLKVELAYLLAIVVCAAAQSAVLLVLRKNPVQIVEKGRKRDAGDSAGA